MEKRIIINTYWIKRAPMCVHNTWKWRTGRSTFFSPNLYIFFSLINYAQFPSFVVGRCCRRCCCCCCSLFLKHNNDNNGKKRFPNDFNRCVKYNLPLFFTGVHVILLSFSPLALFFFFVFYFEPLYGN